MDLTTTYLGLTLSNPFMPGASPLVDDLDTVRRLEDAGAAAIVMHSLFEEQITGEEVGTLQSMDATAELTPEATTSFFPDPPAFTLGPDQYLRQIEKIRDAVDVPVIASLNGTTPGGWLEFARKIEQAGAHALELNVYHLGATLWEPGPIVERKILEVVRLVKGAVSIPVAVKLSPFFSSPAAFARRLDELTIDGLVLFNRFYQPDIDAEALEVVPSLQLSSSSELLLRLRWLALLRGRVDCSLAVSGGVHTPIDGVKALMAGADAVQMVSALLRHGPEHLRVMRRELVTWLEEHEYASLAQLRGSMSLDKTPNPEAYERVNYMRVLQSWRPEAPASG